MGGAKDISALPLFKWLDTVEAKRRNGVDVGDRGGWDAYETAIRDESRRNLRRLGRRTVSKASGGNPDLAPRADEKGADDGSADATARDHAIRAPGAQGQEADHKACAQARASSPLSGAKPSIAITASTRRIP